MKIGRLVRNRRGFTLIWFVASVSLILVAMTMSLSAFYAGGRVISAARSTTAASSAAEGELERIRSLSFDSVSSGGFAISSELAGPLPAGRGYVRVKDVNRTLKEVTVTVDWLQDRERTRHVSLSTLVSRELRRQ